MCILTFDGIVLRLSSEYLRKYLVDHECGYHRHVGGGGGGGLGRVTASAERDPPDDNNIIIILYRFNAILRCFTAAGSNDFRRRR